MTTARQKLVDVLRREPAKSLDIVTVSRKLNKSGALGFGVQAIDVVQALSSRGVVTYDRAQEMVRLTYQGPANRR